MSNEAAEDLAPLIICLIEDGHVTSDDWSAWEATELMRCDGAPAWLAELATTYSANDALALLRSLQRTPTVEERLGTLWLAFSTNQVDSIELLELGLKEAGGWDTGGGFIPYQRELMSLLRRAEALAAAQPGQRRETLEDIERDAIALLEPLGDRVRGRTAGRIAMTGLPRSDDHGHTG